MTDEDIMLSDEAVEQLAYMAYEEALRRYGHPPSIAKWVDQPEDFKMEWRAIVRLVENGINQSRKVVIPTPTDSRPFAEISDCLQRGLVNQRFNAGDEQTVTGQGQS